MVDIAAIQGAISSLQAAARIAKGLIGAQSDIERYAQVIELQDAILNAQAQQSALIERVRELEKEIGQMKAWKEQKHRYKLIYPWQDSMTSVYALRESCKETGGRAEAPHWICTKCYDDGRRTILQPAEEKKRGLIILVCPACKSMSSTGYSGLFNPEYATD